jgi:hypothetical protein
VTGRDLYETLRDAFVADAAYLESWDQLSYGFRDNYVWAAAKLDPPAQTAPIELERKKYYLAGPMTGIPQFNFPAFDSAAARLREAGYDIVTPSELDSPEARKAALASPDGDPDGYKRETGETWGDLLARDVKIVADEVDGVAVLPGWASSRGARLEVFVARLCGKPILHSSLPLIYEVSESTIKQVFADV